MYLDMQRSDHPSGSESFRRHVAIFRELVREPAHKANALFRVGGGKCERGSEEERGRCDWRDGERDYFYQWSDRVE